MAQSTTDRTASVLGLAGAVGSIVLWVIYVFLNPYHDTFEMETFWRTFSMLLLPALLAIYAAWQVKSILMYVAFLWSFPMGVYMSASPGLFKLYGLVLLFYLVSASSMARSKRSPHR